MCYLHTTYSSALNRFEFQSIRLKSKSKSVARIHGDLSDWFTTTAGVRQGCVISLLLFKLLLELVMLYATHNVEIRAQIQGHLKYQAFGLSTTSSLLAENASDVKEIVDKVFQSSLNSLNPKTRNKHLKNWSLHPSVETKFINI